VASDGRLAVAEDSGTTSRNLPLASDIDGDPVTYALGTGATNGTAVVNADGSYTYTPNANYNGPDSFTYTVSDGNGGSNTYTISIIVVADQPTSTIPTGNPDRIPVTEDTIASGNVLLNDIDADGKPLVVTGAKVDINGDGIPDTLLLGAPTVLRNSAGSPIGTLTLNANGNFTFKPALNYNGSVPLVTYTLSNGDAPEVSTTLALGPIKPVNDAPLAINDFFIHHSPISGSLFTNDSDPDRDPLTITSFTIAGFGTFKAGTTVDMPGIGALVINADGSFTLIPHPGHRGPVPVATYTVTDGFAFATADLKFSDETSDFDNSGALILLSNPTPALFPSTSGGGYSLLPFREPDLTWNSDELYSPSKLSLYGNLQDYDLYLTGSLRNQVVVELEGYSFTVPYGTFRHSNPNERLEYEAMLADGSKLPDWLKFDPKELKFTGVPPKGASTVEVMVKAKDSYGNEAFATFKVAVKKPGLDGNGDDFKPHASQSNRMHSNSHLNGIGLHRVVSHKPGFTDQVNAAGKLSRLLESRALLDSLSRL
jgi:Bacterial Ig domain/Bacterial cadherin-like domain/Putative Ig domain